MKNMVLLVVSGLMLPLFAVAEDKRRAGLHLSYSEGGEIVESALGFGGQVEIPVSDGLGVQFAISRFSDEDSMEVGTVKLDIASAGLSAIFKSRGEGSSLYLLAGLNYNSFDANVELAPAYSAANMTSEVEDDIGFHFGAGVEAPVSRSIDFFLEYRYTSTSLEVRTDVSYRGDSASFEAKDDFDFGLLKMGINIDF